MDLYSFSSAIPFPSFFTESSTVLSSICKNSLSVPSSPFIVIPLAIRYPVIIEYLLSSRLMSLKKPATSSLPTILPFTFAYSLSAFSASIKAACISLLCSITFLLILPLILLAIRILPFFLYFINLTNIIYFRIVIMIFVNHYNANNSMFLLTHLCIIVLTSINILSGKMRFL